MATNASLIVGIVLMALGASSLIIGVIRCFTVKVKNSGGDFCLRLLAHFTI